MPEIQDLPSLPPEKGEWDSDALRRRQFLGLSFWTVAGVATLGAAGVAGRFLAGRSLEERAAKWVQIGKVDELPSGQMHRASYTIQVRDAWRQEEQKGTVYVHSPDRITFTVLDATCSHLGCVVRWKEEQQHFACPCHSGFFQPDGSVVSGPPPKALRILANKVENGILWVEV